eukprot:2998849-Pleurochrysis_carterae.AAC.1
MWVGLCHLPRGVPAQGGHGAQGRDGEEHRHLQRAGAHCVWEKRLWEEPAFAGSARDSVIY